MKATQNRVICVSVRLLIGFSLGVLSFFTLMMTLGTFFPVGFGCLFYGGLTMLAAASCSRDIFWFMALGLPFLFVNWADAIADGIVVTIASKVACLISEVVWSEEDDQLGQTT